jgi:hypothetical protein
MSIVAYKLRHYSMDKTLKCPVALRWNKVGKRFAICRRPISADDLLVHFRRDHGIGSREMLQFYLDRAEDPDWADRA